MTSVNETIGRIEFFAGLDQKLLRRVAESALMCQYGCDEVIIREGETGLGMYVIARGRVGVTKERDGVPMHLAQLGPDQFFAEMSLIDEKPRSATITTLEETECLLLTRDSFLKLMEKYPQLSIRMARVLAERLRKSDEKVRLMSEQIGELAPNKFVAGSSHSNTILPPETRLNGVILSTAVEEPHGMFLAYGGAKAAVQNTLLGAFQQLYMAKAFTRFSVAVLGCPVEGACDRLVEEIRIGEVKALILPSDGDASVEIEAYGAGSFTLHVFTPGAAGPMRFGPVEIQPNDRFTLRLPGMTLRTASGREVN